MPAGVPPLFAVSPARQRADEPAAIGFQGSGHNLFLPVTVQAPPLPGTPGLADRAAAPLCMLRAAELCGTHDKAADCVAGVRFAHRPVELGQLGQQAPGLPPQRYDAAWLAKGVELYARCMRGAPG